MAEIDSFAYFAKQQLIWVYDHEDEDMHKNTFLEFKAMVLWYIPYFHFRDFLTLS